jgi:two-component system NtrC family sensor kinase
MPASGGSDRAPSDAFQEHEQMLSTLMAHSPALAWVKDEGGRYRYASPTVLRRFGLAAQDVLGKTDRQVFPAAHETVSAHDQQVRNSGKPLEVVEEVLDAAGLPQHSWFVIKFPLPGAPRGFVGGVAVEITALKRAEREKIEAEDTHRQILDAMPDMVLVKGPQSRPEWANKAFRDAYGMTNEQLRGVIDAPFVEPDQTQQYVTDDRRVFETGASVDIPEEPISRHDGTVRTFHTVKSPIFDAAGQVIKTVGVSRDITDRKHMERELTQAQKLESMGRLASGVAHEINTPIQFLGDRTRFAKSAVADLVSAVQAYRAAIARAKSNGGRLDAEDFARLAAAEDEADVAYGIEHLPVAFDSMLDGVSRVAKIVQAMKQFAHPDKGEPDTADINGALQNTLAIAMNEIRFVAEVETDLAPLPPVRCLIGELNQVFLNLLINAAHAIGDVVQGTGALGKIRVVTRVDGDDAVVSISDTGAGIPEAVRGKIFEPFFTTKEVGRGTGQGLAIARVVVVDKHRGTLSFDTELGRGTTFHVRIPIHGA